MSRNKRKFSNYLINPRYQLRYLFWIVASGLFFISLNAGVFYVHIKENYDILVDLAPMTDEVRNQLYSELNEIVVILTSFSLLMLGLITVIGLVFSHRSAGPIYHFKRVFDQISNGDRDLRVHLRPKDDFREVADSFNQMMDLVQNKKPSSNKDEDAA